MLFVKYKLKPSSLVPSIPSSSIVNLPVSAPPTLSNLALCCVVVGEPMIAGVIPCGLEAFAWSYAQPLEIDSAF